MASGSTIAGFNIPESRDNSLTPAPPEKSITGKGAPRETRQRSQARNPPSGPANKQTGNQAFHDAPIEIISDS